MMQPLTVDGIRHEAFCEIFQTPAFRVIRRPCTCGAVQIMDIRDYLGNLSLAVGHLIKGSNWNCTAMVVLNFGTLSEYVKARHDLMQHTVPARDGVIRPMADGYGEEFDFCGVTFRMRCLEKHVMPHGTYSGVEMVRRGEVNYRRGH